MAGTSALCMSAACAHTHTHTHCLRGFGVGRLPFFTVSCEFMSISAVTSESLALFGRCQVYKKNKFRIKQNMASNDTSVSDCDFFTAKNFVRT